MTTDINDMELYADQIAANAARVEAYREAQRLKTQAYYSQPANPVIYMPSGMPANFGIHKPNAQYFQPGDGKFPTGYWDERTNSIQWYSWTQLGQMAQERVAAGTQSPESYAQMYARARVEGGSTSQERAAWPHPTTLQQPGATAAAPTTAASPPVKAATVSAPQHTPFLPPEASPIATTATSGAHQTAGQNPVALTTTIDKAAPFAQQQAAQAGAQSTQQPNGALGSNSTAKTQNRQTQIRSQASGYSGNRRWHPFSGR